MLLVGGTAVTAAVIVADDDAPPAAAVPALSDFDVHRIAGTLSADEMANQSVPSEDPLVSRFGIDAGPFAQQPLLLVAGPR